MKHIAFQHLTNKQSEIIDSVLGAALTAADPYQAVSRSISLENDNLSISGNLYDLRKLCKIKLISLGKAAGAMASAVMDKMGDYIEGGVIVAKHDLSKWNLPEKIQICYGSHPIPSKKSEEAAESIIDFLQDLTDQDLVICLISGGGSALATKPRNPITISELQTLTSLLLKSGADIQEINTIRKHLDVLKGGGLASAANQARMETLILSDVLEDDISMIASGPTCADGTTFQDAERIIRKYKLETLIPKSIDEVIKMGIAGEIAETVKQGSVLLVNKFSHIVASLSNAVKEAVKAANELGLNATMISTSITGEAKDVGHLYGKYLKKKVLSDDGLKKPAVFIGGGETTVTIKGRGKGGRNQEFAFGAMHEIAGLEDCIVVSIATDGEDGPTNAAGAYVTGETLSNSKEIVNNIEDYERNNDTYHLFERTNNLIKIGPTGTNVNDLILLFAF